jgi:glycosyltransferase involved in cell wall biosynthesis
MKGELVMHPRGALSIALMGTRGVPARYGGFETAIEEVGHRLVERGHAVTVYCRGESGPATHRGMKLVHLPSMKRRSVETLSHTALSVWHARGKKYDAVVMFNAANSPFIPLLRLWGQAVAVHLDGLEWQRAKWQGFGKRYYLGAERLAVMTTPHRIADAQGIADYYASRYGAETALIAYGARIRPREASDSARLAELGLTADGYHLVVARVEPENHVLEALQGFLRSDAKLPLVLVGGNPYPTDYTRHVDKLAAAPRVIQLGGMYDQEKLDALYANALTYVHGHSVGGTNPSLLRALGAGAPVVAFDVVFNREVAAEAGVYFADVKELSACLEEAERDLGSSRARGELGRRNVEARYTWDAVTTEYEGLCRLLAGQKTGRRARADLGSEAPSPLPGTVPGDISDHRAKF